ncbi:MAG: hypothetical protein P8165_17415 [Deltaproteobacteria bacterium]|jgi:hypothetical protein
MANKRTIITISEDDKIWLESYSKALNISVAEVIRRGISRLREAKKHEGYERLVHDTRGIWQKGDGLKYQRDSRSEWNRG